MRKRRGPGGAAGDGAAVGVEQHGAASGRTQPSARRDAAEQGADPRAGQRPERVIGRRGVRADRSPLAAPVARRREIVPLDQRDAVGRAGVDERPKQPCQSVAFEPRCWPTARMDGDPPPGRGEAQHREEAVRSMRRPRLPGGDRGLCVTPRPLDRERRHAPDGMDGEAKRRHDAEVAAAAAPRRPRRGRSARVESQSRTRPSAVTILQRADVVAGEAEAAREEPVATAEGQAGDADREAGAGRNRHVALLPQPLVDRAELRAGADRGRLCGPTATAHARPSGRRRGRARPTLVRVAAVAVAAASRRPAGSRAAAPTAGSARRRPRSRSRQRQAASARRSACSSRQPCRLVARRGAPDDVAAQLAVKSAARGIGGVEELRQPPPRHDRRRERRPSGALHEGAWSSPRC